MKKGEAPQLDCAWWKKCKPVTLKNGDLEAALAAYEHAMDAWDKKQSDENHIARIRSLEAVNGAARSVIKACNRMLHNDTITCLEKFPKLISDKKEALGEQYTQLRTMQAKEFSKILTKMTDKAAVVEETFYGVYDDLIKKQTNLQQVGDYGLGGIDSLSLLIDDLVKDGHQDGAIGAFRDNKNVVKFLDEIDKSSQLLGRISKEMVPLFAKVPQLAKLIALVKREIDDLQKEDYVQTHPKLANGFTGLRNWLTLLDSELDQFGGKPPELSHLQLTDTMKVEELKDKTSRLLRADLKEWSDNGAAMTVASKKLRQADFGKQLAQIHKLAVE